MRVHVLSAGLNRGPEPSICSLVGVRVLYHAVPAMVGTRRLHSLIGTRSWFQVEANYGVMLPPGPRHVRFHQQDIIILCIIISYDT